MAFQNPSAFPWNDDYKTHNVGTVGDEVGVDSGANYHSVTFARIASITKTQATVTWPNMDGTTTKRPFSLGTLREVGCSSNYRIPRLMPAPYARELNEWHDKAKAERARTSSIKARLNDLIAKGTGSKGFADELRAIAAEVDAYRAEK